jgi:hypothetical protein
MKVKVEGEPITEKVIICRMSDLASTPNHQAWFWGRREIKQSASVNIENSDYMVVDKSATRC